MKNMSNVCNEVTKEDLSRAALNEATEILNGCNAQIKRDPSFAESIRAAVIRVLEQLPAKISTLEEFETALKPKADEEERILIQKMKNRKGKINAIRRDVCCTMRCALYADFLAEKTRQLATYMSSHDAPTEWGLVCIKDIPGGKELYEVWTKHIAPTNPEGLFRLKILKELPHEWRKTFEPKVFHRYQ